FSAPVENLSLTLLNVNENANMFKDLVTVTGMNTTDQQNMRVAYTAKKPAEVVTFPANTYNAGTNKIEGTRSLSAATVDKSGNVILKFNEPINVVEIKINNGASGNSIQEVGISHITWKTGSGGFEPGPLPVELVSFIAKATEKTTKLNWTTASEENN